jgi:hypothetical protein
MVVPETVPSYAFVSLREQIEGGHRVFWAQFMMGG